MTSIRFRIGRGSEHADVLAQRVMEYFRHLKIEAESADDCSLWLELAIGTSSNAEASERNGEMRTEITKINNPVDHKFVPFGQVYKELRTNFGHGQTPKDWGIHSVPLQAPESTPSKSEAA